jgi:nitrogenase-stabilizing/protective protein
MTTDEHGPEPDTSAGASVAARLAECRDAEDYFRLFGVEADPAVLAVNRLHILRAFGRELSRLTAEGGPGPSADAVREALTRSYDTFRESTALDHRLFRVLRDHAPRQVIGLDSIPTDPHPDVPPTTPAPRAVDAPLSVVPTPSHEEDPR